MVAVSLFITVIYNNDNLDFLKSQNIEGNVIFWIYVYGLLYIMYFLRRLLSICQWCIRKDPRIAEAKVKCITFSFLNTFEFLWFLYGNTFFYTDIYAGKVESNLWMLFLAILIYGYITMLVYLGSICAIMLVFCTMYS